MFAVTSEKRPSVSDCISDFYVDLEFSCIHVIVSECVTNFASPSHEARGISHSHL